VIELTYRCDGCGLSTSAQQAMDWRSVIPVGSDTHRLANSPLQSHLCPTCWRVAMDAVHMRVLEREDTHSELHSVPRDTRLIAINDPDAVPSTVELPSSRPPVTR
jgi:hypothetical protein